MDENARPAPTVSVVVPVYNGGVEFERCLAALAAASPPPFEVIVAVDGGTDGSASVARARRFRVVELDERGGPSRARNEGSRVAAGDVLMFVDADVAVAPDAVGRVAGRFAEDPQLGALFGSYDDAPGAPNFLSQYKNLFHHYTHQRAREEASTFWSGCGAMRRGLFLEAGGFDERHRCVEDIELGYRLTRAGKKIRVDKELQGKHLKRWSVTSLLRADIFCRALPWTAMIVQGYPFVDDLNLRLSSRVSVALSGLLVLALAATVVWPVPGLAVSAAIAVSLLVLNRDVYRFFYEKRGLRFAACAVAWHWFYFLYSGTAFVAGMIVARYRHRRAGSGGAREATAISPDGL